MAFRNLTPTTIQR